VPRLRADAGEAAEDGREQQARGLDGDRLEVEQLAAARAARSGIGEDRVGCEQRGEQDDVADQEDPEPVRDDDALDAPCSASSVSAAAWAWPPMGARPPPATPPG